MPTKHIKAYEVNGENGIYVRIGENTFSFEGLVEEPNGEKVQYTFTVEGVATEYDAVRMVDYCYCGHFVKYSDRNIRKEVN